MPNEQRTTVDSGRSSGNGFLFFAVGALIVAVGVLAWMFYNGQTNRSSEGTALERVAESIDDLGDSARDAARNIPQPTPPTPQPAPPTPAEPPPG